MGLYRYATKDDLANIKFAPTQDQTKMFDMLGRNTGASTTNNNGNDNFFAKRIKSMENAFGTTGAALVSAVDSAREDEKSKEILANAEQSERNILKKYGYKNRDEYYDKLDALEAAGDTENYNNLVNTVGAEINNLYSNTHKEQEKRANDWADYRNNSYVGQKVNQDQGKFAGSAINTLSTAFDVMAPGAGILANSVQGGIEGIADELEQNGLKDFNWERAGQNALIGATTGAVTGALNKGISNQLAKNGGNLFRGGNAITRGLNNLGSSTTAGRIGSTLATGAARGAVSGAVGGATGAGLSAAMNNQDVLGSAIQGAQQGFGQGALAGGVMAGANMAANATPGVGNVMRQLNEAGDNWKNSGDTFNERLTNTLTSGDSAVGEWLQGNTRSKALQRAGMIGNSIQDVSKTLNSLNPTGTVNTEYDPTFRATAPLGNDMTTYAKTAGISPDQEVTVYRGVPTNASDAINPGDYITTNRQLAQDYAGNGKVIEQKVPASSILDSVSEPLGEEYIYRPSKQAGIFDNTGTRIPDDIANRLNGIDPRLLDEKGNIKVMYHGTPNGGFERPNDGTYFSENKRYADGYQNPSASSLSTKQNANNPMTYEGYLDIKKPFTLADQDARDIYLNEYIKGGNSQYYDPYTDYRKTIDGLDDVDWVEGENLREWLQQNHPEYDGLFLDEGGDGGYGDVEYRWRGKSVVPFSGDQFINRNNLPSQQTPTTLGGWMKQAGKRVIEDANNHGIGLSIKNVANETPEVATTRTTAPETETYRTLTQDQTAMQNTKNGKVGTPAQAENTLKTSKSEQLRYKAAQELLKQYGTVDKPTAKATNAPKTIQEIADAGFTKPGDVERIADNITGSNGEVNKLVQNLVSTAKRVNTFDGLDGKTIDEFIDESIARNALDGINEGKAVKSQIKAYLNSLDSRRNGSVDWSDNPEDVMDVVRGLEAEAANYEGRSGMNYGTTTQDKMNAAKVAKDVATLLKDRVFETVDVKSAMTPEVAQSLKALAPNNKQWSDYVDNKIMTAKNLQDLRSVQAPFVRAKKIIDNGYMNSVTYGGRLGNTASSIPTTKSGIVRDILNNTINTNFANRVKAGALNKAADIADRFSGQTSGGGNSGNVNTQTMALPSGEVSGQVSNPSTRIYDMIGRTEGLSNGEQARTADYLINAAQEAEIVPNANAGTLESLTQTNPMSTSVYNTMTTPTRQMTNSQSGMQSSNSMFPETGDYWTDVLGRAMSAAIEADDVKAFGSLYGMYQDALSNLQKSKGKDYSDITNWNSADRTKLLSAQNAMGQIDQLESAYNQATGGSGGNVLQGNLRSLAANISGGNLDPSANNYNKLAESVGMGIVKNLINLGVTEADAKRYLEYLPALTDTREQAQQKLETLRSIYQNQIDNLYSAYNV